MANLQTGFGKNQSLTFGRNLKLLQQIRKPAQLFVPFERRITFRQGLRQLRDAVVGLCRRIRNGSLFKIELGLAIGVRPIGTAIAITTAMKFQLDFQVLSPPTKAES